MARTLIRGGFVASQDPEYGDQPDTDVLIEDGGIVAVGKNLDVARFTRARWSHNHQPSHYL